MAGLARICKLYGAMVINGKRYVWDYAADRAVLEKTMPEGSERHKMSERIRASQMRTAFQCMARGCDGCSVCSSSDAEGRR